MTECILSFVDTGISDIEVKFKDLISQLKFLINEIQRQKTCNKDDGKWPIQELLTRINYLLLNGNSNYNLIISTNFETLEMKIKLTLRDNKDS